MKTTKILAFSLLLSFPVPGFAELQAAAQEVTVAVTAETSDGNGVTAVNLGAHQDLGPAYVLTRVQLLKRSDARGLTVAAVALERLASTDTSWQEWASRTDKGQRSTITVTEQTRDQRMARTFTIAGFVPLGVTESIETDASGQEQLIERMDLVEGSDSLGDDLESPWHGAGISTLGSTDPRQSTAPAAPRSEVFFMWHTKIDNVGRDWEHITVSGARADCEDEVTDTNHNISAPRDSASGRPTGKRMHKPITITKSVDKAMPILVYTLTDNENVKTWKLECWRPSAEEQYYSIEMVNAN
ncbi:MAG: type VI secretion system tube protein Hcp [Deltaproteobacteria bacterium]|nr:type VI secretion system tube protein Hcp [Deltaproteobacteria bacterium]